MEEGGEDSDFTAAELASLSGKGSFNRAISVAFSQASIEGSTASERQGDGTGDEPQTCEVKEAEEDYDDENNDDGGGGDGDSDDDGGGGGDGNEEDVREDSTGGNAKSDAIKFQICSASGTSNAKDKSIKPNKKRKRRRKLNLAQKQFLGTVAGDIHTTPQEQSAVDVNLLRPVPTLVELCLRKGMHKAEISEESQPSQIAPGIRLLLKVHQNQTDLVQIQLKWLLEALKQAEQQLKYNMLQYMNRHGRQAEFFVRDCRPLTCSDDESRSIGREFHKDNRSNVSLAVAVGGYDNSDWAVAALAHCIDVLLPTHLPEEGPKNAKTAIIRVKRFLSQHSSTLVNHCFDTAMAYVWWCRGEVDRAKTAFLDVCSRIPTHNEVRVHPESEAIYRSRTVFDRQKSLYYTEIGRLLAQFDQPELAMHFHRRAVDVISEGASVVLDRLVLQSCALGASAYDQGIMDPTHAAKAATFWDMAASDRECKVELIQASVESFLHCHAGCCISKTESFPGNDKNMSWLLEANSRIEALGAKAPQVYLYQSLIRTLLGEQRLAEEAYGRYVQQYCQQTDHYVHQDAGPMPGSLACSGFGRFKSQPWWVLLEWMASKATLAGSSILRPIPVLPLLWRRTLKQPCHTDYMDPGKICDIQGQSPNLHLTHDGYLSGTFMQNLPPMKSVLLDPHTGSVCVPDHRQFELQGWDNYQPLLYTAADFSLNCLFPIPVLLYHNAVTKTVVTLMNVNSNVNFREGIIHFDPEEGVSLKNANTSSTLVYSRGSETVRINLRELVLEARRQNIIQQVKDLGPCIDQTVMQDILDVLDFCMKRGLQIDLSLVKEVIDGKQKALMEIVRQTQVTKSGGQSQKEVKEGQKKKPANAVEMPPHQTLQLQEVLYVGNSTVVLCLYTGANKPYYGWEKPEFQDTLVFVDCSSPEVFSNPVIRCPDLPDLDWMLPDQTSCWKSKHFKQNVLFAYADRYRPGGLERALKLFVVFDEHGSVIYRERFKQRQGSTSRLYDACSGWHILGHDWGKKQIRCLNAQNLNRLSEPVPEVDNFVVEQDMVFVSGPSSVIVLDPVFLKPLHVQKRSSTATWVSKTDGVLVEGECSHLCVLATTDFSKPSSEEGNKQIAYTRVILGVANYVVILERQKSSLDPCTGASSPVQVVADMVVPGIPKEAYYISKHAGLIVTATQFHDTVDPYNRENLYWFDAAGVIRGIHPVLGPGPHGFTAIPLCTQEKESAARKMDGEEEVDKRKRWHLFFADGFGALCCIRLDVFDPWLL